MRLNEDARGIYVISATPFAEDGEYAELDRLLTRLERRLKGAG
jgi:hypothetical protein